MISSVIAHIVYVAIIIVGAYKYGRAKEHESAVLALGKMENEGVITFNQKQYEKMMSK